MRRKVVAPSEEEDFERSGEDDICENGDSGKPCRLPLLAILRGRLPPRKTRWERFVVPLDPRAVAWGRVLLGYTCLCEIFSNIEDSDWFLHDHGMNPRHNTLTRLNTANRAISIYMAVGDTVGLAILLILHTIFAVRFMIGDQAQTSAFALWVFHLGIDSRTQITRHAGDFLLRTLVLWCVFFPSGDRFSVDAWRREGVQTVNGEAGKKQGGLSCRLAALAKTFRAIVQGWVLPTYFAGVYYCAGIRKVGPAWQGSKGGNAVWHVANLCWAKPFAAVLLALPGLCRLLTFTTIWLELLGPILLMIPSRRVRGFMVVAFIGFHFSMHITLDIGCFQPACIAGHIAMMPSWLCDIIEVEATSVARRLGRFARLPAWIAAKFAKASTALPRSRLRMAARRERADADGERPSAVVTAPLADAAISAVILFVCYACLRSMVRMVADGGGPCCTWQPIGLINEIAHAVGLHQNFIVFAPNPPSPDYWILMPALVVSQEEPRLVNLWGAEGRISLPGKPLEPSASPPAWPGKPYATHRWKKLFEHSSFDSVIDYLGKSVCARWKQKWQPTEGELRGFWIVRWNVQISAVPDQPRSVSDPQPSLMMTWYCDGVDSKDIVGRAPIGNVLMREVWFSVGPADESDQERCAAGASLYHICPGEATMVGSNLAVASDNLRGAAPGLGFRTRVSNGSVCARRADGGSGWDVDLQVKCWAPSGHTMVAIGSSTTALKCVDVHSDVRFCPADGGDPAHRANWHDTHDDKFKLWLEEGDEGSAKLCAQRQDKDTGWDMALQVVCSSDTVPPTAVPVRIGQNLDGGTKCVLPQATVLSCLSEAGDPGRRLNYDRSDATFVIEKRGRQLCATRKDSTGWNFPLLVACEGENR